MKELVNVWFSTDDLYTTRNRKLFLAMNVYDCEE